MYDLTFERDQLDRADPAPDWGDEIPFDGAPLPPDPDPAAAPMVLELVAAQAYDIVREATDDPYLAERVMLLILKADKLDKALASVPRHEQEPP